MTCPLCKNTGAVGHRFCTCEAALALRVRIDNDPRIRDYRERMLAILERQGVPGPPKGEGS